MTNCDVVGKAKCLILHNIFLKQGAKQLILERLLYRECVVMSGKSSVMQAQ